MADCFVVESKGKCNQTAASNTQQHTNRLLLTLTGREMKTAPSSRKMATFANVQTDGFKKNTCSEPFVCWLITGQLRRRAFDRLVE